MNQELSRTLPSVNTEREGGPNRARDPRNRRTRGLKIRFFRQVATHMRDQRGVSREDSTRIGRELRIAASAARVAVQRARGRGDANPYIAGNVLLERRMTTVLRVAFKGIRCRAAVAPTVTQAPRSRARRTRVVRTVAKPAGSADPDPEPEPPRRRALLARGVAS